jgi:uncharacterized RDD family membrane protein YckC
MTEQNLQGQYSGLLSRAIAFIIDGAITSLTVLTGYWLSSQLLQYFARIRVGACIPIQGFDLFAIACNASTWSLNAFALGFPLLYLLFFWVRAGQTPGKRLLGLRVVRLNGRRMTLLVGLRRLLGYLACFLSLGIGFLWVLIDDRRQGWHDKLAGTCVVYAWEARQDEQYLERTRQRINQRQNPSSPEASEADS